MKVGDKVEVVFGDATEPPRLGDVGIIVKKVLGSWIVDFSDNVNYPKHDKWTPEELRNCGDGCWYVCGGDMEIVK